MNGRRGGVRRRETTADGADTDPLKDGETQRSVRSETKDEEGKKGQAEGRGESINEGAFRSKELQGKRHQGLLLTTQAKPKFPKFPTVLVVEDTTSS